MTGTKPKTNKQVKQNEIKLSLYISDRESGEELPMTQQDFDLTAIQILLVFC